MKRPIKKTSANPDWLEVAQPGSLMSEPEPKRGQDFANVRGQEAAKRGLLVALTGNHWVCLIGPSGWGKTMLVEAAQEISPKARISEITYEPGTPDIPLHEASALVEIFLEVPAVPFRELTGKRPGTDTAYIVKAMERALDPDTPIPPLVLDDTCLTLMSQVMSELGMNARQYAASIRVAQTIARLDGATAIGVMHLAEAVQYRRPNR